MTSPNIKVGKMKFAYFWLSLIGFGASCAVLAHSPKIKMIYCPDGKKIVAALKQHKTHLDALYLDDSVKKDVSIGEWIINGDQQVDHLKFQKATYLLGDPACFYTADKKVVAIKITPWVQYELYPGWKQAVGGREQTSAPDCKGARTDCPWKALMWLDIPGVQ